MKKNYKIIFITFCFFAISGCTSKPREVTASIPLVSASQEKPNKKELPEQYWTMLADSRQTQLAHDKYTIHLSELYISALGFSCRELMLIDIDKNEQKRIACEISFLNKDKKQDKAWFLEEQIIESSGYVEL